MSDYLNMTQEDYDRLLMDILKKMRASQLITISGIYEIVSDEFNNDVLTAWDNEQE